MCLSVLKSTNARSFFCISLVEQLRKGVGRLPEQGSCRTGCLRVLRNQTKCAPRAPDDSLLTSRIGFTSCSDGRVGQTGSYGRVPMGENYPAERRNSFRVRNKDLKFLVYLPIWVLSLDQAQNGSRGFGRPSPSIIPVWQFLSATHSFAYAWRESWQLQVSSVSQTAF
jgi:hypothetical protein